MRYHLDYKKNRIVLFVAIFVSGLAFIAFGMPTQQGGCGGEGVVVDSKTNIEQESAQEDEFYYGYCTSYFDNLFPTVAIAQEALRRSIYNRDLICQFRLYKSKFSELFGISMDLIKSWQNKATPFNIRVLWL